MSESPLRRRKRRSVALPPREGCNAAPADDLEREQDIAAAIAFAAAKLAKTSLFTPAAERVTSIPLERADHVTETMAFYTTEYDVRRRYADALVKLRANGRCLDWPDEPWSVKT